ncbi:hypothetical protein EJB05_01301, partial [Eragrostis curvula]
MCYVLTSQIQYSLRNTQRGDAVTTSVSGRVDDLSYRCSSDTFDLDSLAFNISENWDTEFEKLTWDSTASKVHPSPSGRSMKLKACKGSTGK